MSEKAEEIYDDFTKQRDDHGVGYIVAKKCGLI